MLFRILVRYLVRTRPRVKRTGVEKGEQQSKWKGVDWNYEDWDRGQLKAVNFGVTYTEWNSWLGNVWCFCLMTSMIYELIWIFLAFWRLWESKTCCRRCGVRNELLLIFSRTKIVATKVNIVRKSDLTICFTAYAGQENSCSPEMFCIYVRDCDILSLLSFLWYMW